MSAPDKRSNPSDATREAALDLLHAYFTSPRGQALLRQAMQESLGRKKEERAAANQAEKTCQPCLTQDEITFLLAGKDCSPKRKSLRGTGAKNDQNRP